jgi:excisionase family DNA binding protein
MSAVDIPGLDEIRRVVREEIESVVQPLTWLNVEQAAQYLATTQDAIRALVKRRQLTVHRTATGRLLFRREELDEHAAAGDAA